MENQNNISIFFHYNLFPFLSHYILCHRRSLQAMPRPVSPQVVAEYAAAFGREEKLKHVGFSFLCDITGKLFQARKPNLRDMNGNCEAGSL